MSSLHLSFPGINLHRVRQITDKKDVDDIQYITFLSMGRAGLRGLEFYDPETGKHGQAHMQARSVISTCAVGFLLKFNACLVALALPSILSKAVSRGLKKSEMPTVI